MIPENCGAFASELAECARNGVRPPGDLDAHLDGCTLCRERWESESLVTAALRGMRMQAAGRSLSAESGRQLMRAFDRQHSIVTVALSPRKHSGWQQTWGWGLAAAAMVLVTVSAVAPLRSHFGSDRSRIEHSPVAAAESVSSDFASSDAASLTSDDFVAVPFAPPLASGELIRIVQTDLDPQELATLGFDPDPSWPADVPAEIVVGEDGYPRAVRISDNSQF